jgi:hypothetical protein
MAILLLQRLSNLKKFYEKQKLKKEIRMRKQNLKPLKVYFFQILLGVAFLIMVGYSLDSKAEEINYDFSKKEPASWNFYGKIEKQNDKYVAVAEGKTYGLCRINIEIQEPLRLNLKLNLKSLGNAKLGVILYKEQQNKKLKRIKHLCWLQGIKTNKFQDMEVLCPKTLIKEPGKYALIIYRSNMKGTLIFQRIAINFPESKKNAKFFTGNKLDIVSPATIKPSGIVDYRIRIAGINPSKSIKNIWIYRQGGGSWTSGKGIKKTTGWLHIATANHLKVANINLLII